MKSMQSVSIYNLNSVNVRLNQTHSVCIGAMEKKVTMTLPSLTFLSSGAYTNRQRFIRQNSKWVYVNEIIRML